MKKTLNFFAACIATGLGSGFSPWLSGTAGSLALLLIWGFAKYLGLLDELSYELGLLGALAVFGTLATHIYLNTRNQTRPDRKKLDPSEVVVDEWAGQMIPLIGLSLQPYYLPLAAFVLFRVFDIWKPWLVAKAEKAKPPALGVMLDDLLAGVCALIVLRLGMLCIGS